MKERKRERKKEGGKERKKEIQSVIGYPGGLKLEFCCQVMNCGEVMRVFSITVLC